MEEDYAVCVRCAEEVKVRRGHRLASLRQQGGLGCEGSREDRARDYTVNSIVSRAGESSRSLPHWQRPDCSGHSASLW